jgi:carbon storage regulator CsrA
MLVLTRKSQQQIQIGQEITVTVLRIRGNTVRLGIEAPGLCRVMRVELLQKSEAADNTPPSSVPEAGEPAAGAQPFEGAQAEAPPEADLVGASRQPGGGLRRRVSELRSASAVRYPARLTGGTLRGLMRR